MDKKNKKKVENIDIMDMINKESGLDTESIPKAKIETFKVRVEHNNFPRAKYRIVNGTPKYFFE